MGLRMSGEKSRMLGWLGAPCRTQQCDGLVKNGSKTGPCGLAQMDMGPLYIRMHNAMEDPCGFGAKLDKQIVCHE